MRYDHLTLPDLPTLAERLVWAREHRDWTQHELAKRSGVSRDVIAKTERGITRMPPRIAEIAQALDVPPAWLAFGPGRIAEWDAETLEVADAYQRLPETTRNAIKILIESAAPADAPEP